MTNKQYFIVEKGITIAYENAIVTLKFVNQIDY